MSYAFFMPNISLMGPGCVKKISEEINSRGLKKALIVCGKRSSKSEEFKGVTDLLEENNIDYVVYPGSQPNPTVKNVMDGVEILKENDCDFVISYGGGSPHDCAKGIALVATNGGNIKDYEGINKSKKPQLPLISINTTAGTASEMTVFSIITDEDRHVKMAIVDKNVTPILAVNDPELMVSMPKSLTAATGMDALTHAVEAYVSTAATPVTDACAQKAIELISQHLRDAVEDGTNMEARDMMAYAEYLAGMAFNSASLGYVHAIAHQLGGFYNLPHGVCNAILLPEVQEFNSRVSSNKLKDIAKFMGVDISNMSDEEGAKSCINAIRKLSSDVGIPSGLKELGVKVEDFDTLADNALRDACGLTNPIKATHQDVKDILTKAMGKEPKLA
ncbi:L-threonine dehydrogenase [Paraclostridium sordellii]|uniref:Alcohol dehydrogenase n=1 Tax=Paraclostridium sordellii TaxID=1505 RepID=A0A0C7PB75_PARSO|nr:L-threonine dehydrogenase [Paeniclostridium sordellii]CEN78812.1 alcohol dehydrogenase [[Clostridium] sordellii] [Paeniclostridium sordellii]CEO09770.1 alcohol dehydrogenase [[Clostridium] sordellii] [Paeniclostridium sordellii]CEP87636.1 alcohol dehydrogenase [[Clostridium] sordellii] [Paeniclostridium sordellii]CEP95972.1 alcohol dehydrogenase [[Clostridium] sordellii] [Paeniclostridium sordellii]CEP98684.1 alcohol dehydrogenase [[Clostridium] sordellii] [Paeniclostridium sordellii]